jgi:CBS domain-containing protein
MRARDVMSTDIVTVAAKASLLKAAELMINAGVSGLPVTDEQGNLAGFLSEYDLIRRVMGNGDSAPFDLQAHLEGRDALSGPYAQVLAEPVSRAMSAPAIAVKESTPLQVVADLMLKHRARCIPVIRGAALVGVVARVDLVKALLSRPRDAAKTVAALVELPAVDDEVLRRLVTESVRRLGLPLGGGFDVVARHGVIHLWGEATDEDAHQAYRAAAARVTGVRDVHSHMQVVPQHRPVGSRRW